MGDWIEATTDWTGRVKTHTKKTRKHVLLNFTELVTPQK